jgi:putative SOS response-associated peptidase YedK
MCGRFAFAIGPTRLAAILGVEPPREHRPCWNVAPDMKILIVRRSPEGLEAVLARWGFLAPWMSDPNDPGRQINARLETAAQKPMFRSALVKGRCIVPADGFFEWQKQPEGPSRPFFVRPADHELLLMAGLWRRNRLEDGTLIDTVAILTRPADATLHAIHPRMPVLLPERLVDPWLATKPASTNLLRQLLDGSHDAPRLDVRVVGRAINDPRNDTPSAIEPITVDFQPDLF